MEENAMLTQPHSEELNIKEKLIIIAALCGEISYDLPSRLGATSNYERHVRYLLYKEDYLRHSKENDIKSLFITGNGFERLSKDNPSRYKYVDTKIRTEPARRYRRRLFGYTYCSLFNSDIEFLPDKKPYIFSRSRDDPYVTQPYPLLLQNRLSSDPVFYSSVEIKYELEDNVQQIRNSAMLGLILTDKDRYVLYNAHDCQYPMSYATELKVSLMTSNGTFIQNKKDTAAIVLVSDMINAAALVIGNKDLNITPSMIIMNEAYKHIYLVPETEDGDTQLQVLCHEDLRDMIDITFEENFGKPNPSFSIVNDGFDEDNNPVLNCCHLDIIRLMRFKRGLLVNDLTGRILCYDFQMEFIRKVMKPAKIEINHIKIKDVKEMIVT